ncbi:hypothetical protein Acsp02_77050 [Actinoplanes sp. NBRC 103695]|nr:hypothetical protein Acsp02_77050 [Actinoplanes sp. NBRC 103695]
MAPVSSRRTSAVRRPRQGPPKPPQAPADLSLANALQLDIEHEQTVEAVAYYDADLAGADAEGVEFRQCRFRKASLAGAALSRVRMADCLIETCDLSNLKVDGAAFDRIKVSGTRMTGLACYGGLVSDATFVDCKSDLTNWRQTRLDRVTFQKCNLAGADFTDADLRGASFTDCDLTRAQFHKATMTGARFRNCELQGIGGITSWEGAIIHPDDLLAMSYLMAGALGIVVDDRN